LLVILAYPTLPTFLLSISCSFSSLIRILDADCWEVPRTRAKFGVEILTMPVKPFCEARKISAFRASRFRAILHNSVMVPYKVEGKGGAPDDAEAISLG